MSENTKNPLHAIRIRHAEHAPIRPEDFGNKAVPRALFEPSDRRKHAMLRAAGYSAAESFMAAFGHLFIAAPEALALAADAYETTNTFGLELDAALATVDPVVRDKLLDQRVAEFTALAAGAAADLEPLLKKYIPETYVFARESDFEAFDAIIAARQKEVDVQEQKERRDAALFKANLDQGYFE